MISLLKVIKLLVTAVCLAGFIKELIIIVEKSIGKDSFQAINQLVYKELLAPTITFCPGPAWKASGPFLSEEEYIKNKYHWDEIFHPVTLKALRNKARGPCLAFKFVL